MKDFCLPLSLPLTLSEYPCSGMLGMVSGLITDAQITASSHTDRSWVPENARLLTSRSGWTLLPQPQPFTSEWLQVRSTILIDDSYGGVLALQLEIGLMVVKCYWFI